MSLVPLRSISILPPPTTSITVAESLISLGRGRTAIAILIAASGEDCALVTSGVRQPMEKRAIAKYLATRLIFFLSPSLALGHVPADRFTATPVTHGMARHIRGVGNCNTDAYPKHKHDEKARRGSGCHTNAVTGLKESSLNKSGTFPVVVLWMCPDGRPSFHKNANRRARRTLWTTATG